MKIAIGNDHSAVDMRRRSRQHLKERGYRSGGGRDFLPGEQQLSGMGGEGSPQGCAGEADLGIAICGTGVGISIACNKVKGIRAVCCSEPYSARMSRQHNNSNVLCFGARVIGVELAKMIVDEWLDAQFLGGRHQTRIDMIAEIESKG